MEVEFYEILAAIAVIIRLFLHIFIYTKLSELINHNLKKKHTLFDILINIINI